MECNHLENKNPGCLECYPQYIDTKSPLCDTCYPNLSEDLMSKLCLNHGGIE
jgi:hypothetical protein